MMVAQKDRALRLWLPVFAPTSIPERASSAVGRQKPRREAIRLHLGGDARRRHAVGAGACGAVGVQFEVRRAKAVRVGPARRGNERHHRGLPVTDDIYAGTTFPPPRRPIHDHVAGERSSGLHLLADARDGRSTPRWYRRTRLPSRIPRDGLAVGRSHPVAEGARPCSSTLALDKQYRIFAPLRVTALRMRYCDFRL